MSDPSLTSSLNYFKWMIDERGIIQFTKGYEKDWQYGYAVEDQARALFLSLQLHDSKLIHLFTSILINSYTPEKGIIMLRDKFGQSLNKFDKRGEAAAQVLWALSASNPGLPFLSKLVNDLTLSEYPRSHAYALLGLELLGNKDYSLKSGIFLLSLYKSHRASNWHWFEEKITYANGLLPQALLSAYLLTSKKDFLSCALEALEFLINNCQMLGKPCLIGSEGWWRKGGKKALYVQQPIDAAYLVICLFKAWQVTHNHYYLEKLNFFYSWFNGNNIANVPLIRRDGACYDGLNINGVNPNCGAESNICYLLARLTYEKAQRLF